VPEADFRRFAALDKLDDTGVITLKNIMKVPGYIDMTYGDEEEYKGYLR
jgi:hypothetical protein